MNEDLQKCRQFCHSLKPFEKLFVLKDMASRVYKERDADELRQLRSEFLERRKFKKLFKKICFVCGKKANLRHHIVQLQYGGANNKKNVIGLCRSCHSKIHPWLDGKTWSAQKMDAEFKAVVQ